MPQRIPFDFVLQYVLAGNGIAQQVYSVPPGEDFEIDEFRFASTGAFSITAMKTSDGLAMTNATQSVGIPSTALQAGNSPNIGLRQFAEPLLVKGGLSFILEIKDTSGAGNTINAVFSGVRILNQL